ncbi:MAG: MFS transporter, partial [bacterium]
MPPLSDSQQHDAYAALRLTNYRVFASGFLVSSLGLQMLATALGWEIYERTGDALHLGLIGLFRALPVIALALPAGHFIDRFDKKRVLIVTQLAMGVITALLAVASFKQAPLWMMYSLVALAGCARVFNGPSRATLLPLIVPHNIFGNASTWNSGVFHVSGALGPIIAGYLLHKFQAAWVVYTATCAGCLYFGLFATMLQTRADARHTGPFSFSSVTAGLGHVWKEKSVLGAITLDLFAVLLGGATALLPIYAKDILTIDGEPAGERGLGFLKAAPYVGAAIMAFVLAHKPPFKHAGKWLLWSVAAFGV